MQKITTPLSRWSKARNGARSISLALVLAVLAGCAGSTLGPKSVGKGTSVTKEAETEGLSVVRLEDGREGFVITETSSLSAESRRNFGRAVELMEEREYGQAIGLLERIIERSPGVTAPYINLAIACMHNSQPKQAEQHLQTALELVPGHPAASNEYGLLLRRDGRFAEARSVFEKTLTIFPEFLPARRNLGILCDLYLDDLTCALDQYEIYSQAMPGDEQVKLWIADLRIRLGRN